MRHATCSLLLAALLFAGCSESRRTPPPDGSTGTDGSMTTDAPGTDGGIDCSTVGCGAPPLCSEGCAEPCGCCSCSEGTVEVISGMPHQCTGGCWAPLTTPLPDGGIECASGCVLVCEGGECGCQCPTSCMDDMGCGAELYCDPCAYSSCPGCDDCNAGCVPHGCTTETMLTCRCARPDCGTTGVAIVRDGCWVCVDRSSCEDIRGGC